jgi:two-component system LytT family response regulator
MNRLRLLIVDDEPLIRSGIREALTKIGDVEIAGECESGAQAIASIGDLPIDVVLLDVQMLECTGLDVVRHVGAERMPMVIFVTAYDEYAVKAFEMNAVDYLLKPFDEERLQQAIERARERGASRDRSALAAQLQSLVDANRATNRAWLDRLVVRNTDRYEFVPVESIEWIESADNYVELHCGNQTHLLSETLGGVEEKLDPRKFRRIHRRRIVNLSRITAIHPIVNGTYTVELRNGTRLATGRQYRDAIQGLIKV